jgi:hypothetical protein
VRFPALRRTTSLSPREENLYEEQSGCFDRNIPVRALCAGRYGSEEREMLFRAELPAASFLLPERLQPQITLDTPRPKRARSVFRGLDEDQEDFVLRFVREQNSASARGGRRKRVLRS